MADFNSDEFQAAYVDEPSSKLDVTKQHGRKRTMSAQYTLLAEVALNETFAVGKLPAGAKLLDARFIAPSDGTTGQYDLGWLDNGVEAVDQNGVFAGATEGDTGGGAVDSKLLGTAAGYGQKFSAETTIQAQAIEATTASIGDTLKWELTYIVD